MKDEWDMRHLQSALQKMGHDIRSKASGASCQLGAKMDRLMMEVYVGGKHVGQRRLSLCIQEKLERTKLLR